VQVPAGFDGGAMTLRIPRAVMVQALFGEANAAVQAEALRLLQRVPAAELPLVERLLGESPPSFRLDRLAEFVRSDPRPEAAEMTVAISPLRPTLRAPRPALSALVPTCLVNEFDPRWGTPPSA
jgi:hypothetical protein